MWLLWLVVGVVSAWLLFAGGSGGRAPLAAWAWRPGWMRRRAAVRDLPGPVPQSWLAGNLGERELHAASAAAATATTTPAAAAAAAAVSAASTSGAGAAATATASAVPAASAGRPRAEDDEAVHILPALEHWSRSPAVGAASRGCFVVWYGPAEPVVVLTHPALVACVLRGEQEGAFVKGYEEEFAPWLGRDSILLARGEKWHRRRRLCAPAFDPTHLDGAFACCQDAALELIRSLETSLLAGAATGGGGAEVDLHGELTRCGLHIIGRAAMNVDLLTPPATPVATTPSSAAAAATAAVASAEAAQQPGHHGGGEAGNMLRDFQTVLTEIERRSYSEVVPLPPALYALTAGGRRFRAAVDRLRASVLAIISARRRRMRELELARGEQQQQQQQQQQQVDSDDQTGAKGLAGAAHNHREDLLDMLLLGDSGGANGGDGDGDAPLTDEEVCQDMMTFLFAGHETTSIAVFWTLYLLSRHPEAEQRCLAECMAASAAVAVEGPAAAGTNGADAGTPAPPSARRAMERQLPFVDACVSEAMRLFPPQPASVRTAVRDVELRPAARGAATEGEHDDRVGGGDSSGDAAATVPPVLRISAGCDVSVVPYLLHRDPGEWSRANEFVPERWMKDEDADEGVARQAIATTATTEKQKQKKKKRHPFSYIPFSGGRRYCVGRPLALMEARVVVAALLPRFRFTWPDDALPRPQPAVTLRPTSHRVRIERRVQQPPY